MEKTKQVWKVSELVETGYARKKLIQIANSRLNENGRLAFRYNEKGDWYFFKAKLDEELRSGRIARSGLIV